MFKIIWIQLDLKNLANAGFRSECTLPITITGGAGERGNVATGVDCVCVSKRFIANTQLCCANITNFTMKLIRSQISVQISYFQLHLFSIGQDQSPARFNFIIIVEKSQRFYSLCQLLSDTIVSFFFRRVKDADLRLLTRQVQGTYFCYFCIHFYMSQLCVLTKVK